MRSIIYLKNQRYNWHGSFNDRSRAFDTGRRLKRKTGAKYFVLRDKSLWDGQTRWNLYLTRSSRG